MRVARRLERVAARPPLEPRRVSPQGPYQGDTSPNEPELAPPTGGAFLWLDQTYMRDEGKVFPSHGASHGAKNPRFPVIPRPRFGGALLYRARVGPSWPRAHVAS